MPVDIAHPSVDALDDAVEALVARGRGVRAVDRLMYGLSEAGDHGLMWLAIAAVGATFGTRRHRLEAQRLAIGLAVESIAVNGLVKSLFRRQRPDHSGDHPHVLRIPRTSSFPSGHASAGACAAVLLGEGRPAPLRVAVWMLAGLVGASRVHVRVHHASDVLAGFAIGALIGAIARRAWPIR